MVTLKDIAKKAGVSTATVSRVLNKAESRVPISQKTRENVIQCAEELSYVPNMAARALATRKTRTLGLIFPGQKGLLMSDPYFSKVFSEIEHACAKQDYHLLVSTFPRSEAKYPVPAMIIERRVDGVIILGPYDIQFHKNILQYEIPKVMLLDNPQDTHFMYVGSDNRKGAHDIVNYLLDLGHRRIAFVLSLLAPPSMAERLEGYKEALNTKGIPVDESLIVRGDAWGDKIDEIRELLRSENRPTAVFTGNDVLAMKTYQVAHEFSLKIPDQLSVAGFDGIETSAHLSPPLTTVYTDRNEIGRQAIDCLLESIEKRAVTRPMRVISTQIRIRKSCAQLN